jgi:2-phospho-L-lactate transferase/gluconeogenesis factor (CofD/UPF0052 family)
VGLLLGGYGPQFMAGSLDTVHLFVVTQVDRDEINDEWIVPSTGREIHRVQIAGVEAPPAFFVPASDIAELFG